MLLNDAEFQAEESSTIRQVASSHINMHAGSTASSIVAGNRLKVLNV